jgi:PmbA protein
MTDLLDTGALVERARRLADAARKAGADAADVMAVRGMSVSVQMREGKVEGSERSEGDDLGLRVFVGRRSASVSSNDPREDFAALAERAVAIAKVAPEDPYAGLADPADLAKNWADLDLLDPTLTTVAELEDFARRAEAAALAVPGVTKSGGAGAGAGLGGFALVTTSGFEGVSLGSSTSFSTTAIAGEGTGMERDYDYASFATGRSRCAGGDRPQRRRAGGAPARPAQGRYPQTVPVIFDARTAGTLPASRSAANGQSVARGTLPEGQAGRARVRPGHLHRRRSAAPRGLGSRPFDGEGVAARPMTLVDDGVLTGWLLDTATARELGMKTHRPRLARHRRTARLPSHDQPLSGAGHRVARVHDRIGEVGRALCHRHDRPRRQHGHRRLQPRLLRLLDRERRTRLSGRRDHHCRQPRRHLPQPDTGE